MSRTVFNFDLLPPLSYIWSQVFTNTFKCDQVILVPSVHLASISLDSNPYCEIDVTSLTTSIKMTLTLTSMPPNNTYASSQAQLRFACLFQGLCTETKNNHPSATSIQMTLMLTPWPKFSSQHRGWGSVHIIFTWHHCITHGEGLRTSACVKAAGKFYHFCQWVPTEFHTPNCKMHQVCSFGTSVTWALG